MSKINIYKSNLGNLIKKRRKAMGFSIDKLAYLIGKDVLFVNEIESKNVTDSSLNIILKIADALNISIYYFIRKDVTIKDVLKWLE